MNHRIFKKKSKRAMNILIAKHGYQPSDFKFADGDETLYAPSNFETKRGDIEGYFTPLRGTPLHWYQTSYEYDEWDAKGACQLLDEFEVFVEYAPEE